MQDFRLSTLLEPGLAEVRAYPASSGSFVARLDSNEAPALFSPDACAALAGALVPDAWNRYPDARATELRAAIAARAGASPDEVLVGAASDEVIALLLTALRRPRAPGESPRALTVTPTFPMYRLNAKVRGFDVVEVPLDAAWDLDVGAMCAAIEASRPNLVFLASPNNPTGALFSIDRLRAVIAAASESIVVIDEAYIDFAPTGRSQLSLLRAFPNVVVLQTLSKVGLASLRVGWMIGPAELVREVDKVRQPYNVTTPSQRAATLVLRELGDELERVRAVVIAERERLSASISRLGLVVSPSDANFLWVETPGPAAPVLAALAARGISVRGYHEAGERLARRLRVTVGLASENDYLLDVLAGAL